MALVLLLGAVLLLPLTARAQGGMPIDVKKREAMVHDIQCILMRDKVIAILLFEQAFIWGGGPWVADEGAGRIPGFPYSAPFEDLRLKN